MSDKRTSRRRFYSAPAVHNIQQCETQLFLQGATKVNDCSSSPYCVPNKLIPAHRIAFPCHVLRCERLGSAISNRLASSAAGAALPLNFSSNVSSLDPLHRIRFAWIDMCPSSSIPRIIVYVGTKYYPPSPPPRGTPAVTVNTSKGPDHYRR